jgi:hypothetical protein
MIQLVRSKSLGKMYVPALQFLVPFYGSVPMLFLLAVFVPLFFQRLYELRHAPARSTLHPKQKFRCSFTVKSALQDSTP